MMIPNSEAGYLRVAGDAYNVVCDIKEQFGGKNGEIASELILYGLACIKDKFGDYGGYLAGKKQRLLTRSKLADDAELLKQRREALGVTTAQAAKVMGCKEDQIKAFEAGSFYIKTFLRRYADFLEVDLKELRTS